METVGKFVTPVEIVTSLRIPTKDDMVAEKDREEQLRTIARWVINNGGEIEFDRKGAIEILTPKGPMLASPGDHIVRNHVGEFYPYKHEDFSTKHEFVGLVQG